MKKPSLWRLLRKVHDNEEGVISLETILIIGAISLPILICLLKFGWPMIRDYFVKSLKELDDTADTVRTTPLT